MAAVTGTNGKSTVTALLGEMGQQVTDTVQVGGNIGTPVLDLLAADAPAWYALELSSFQLESIYSLKPQVAALLNISADHMNRYRSLEDYIQAKQRIFNHAAFAVYNRDDALTRPPIELPGVSFGLDEPQDGQFGIRSQAGDPYFSYGDECLLAVNSLKIKGRHNWANALAALAIGQAMDLPMAAMLTALQTFPGLEHRCQWLREINGVNWYNDSKATNTGACVAALYGLGEGLAGKIVLIAGGQGKGADFTDLRKAVVTVTDHVIVYGEDKLLLSNALQDSASIYQVDDLQAAVLSAHANARSGDIVLLAPACASFDMFNDFEHRGEVFSRMVAAL